MSVSFIVNKYNMAEIRFCEMIATQTSPNLEIYNTLCGPWNNMLCVQRSVS